MNPLLRSLQPYPFQKLSHLLEGITANASLAPINLHIGEPKHETPAFILTELAKNLNGVANYPTTLGSKWLRASIATWLAQRYQLTAIDPETEIIPVNGSREALFAFAQTVINSKTAEQPIVVCSNPFYQIYEGAAYLAGAEPYYLSCHAHNQFSPDFDSVPAEVWQRTQLLFICSPANPTGTVLDKQTLTKLIELSDKYNFVIASDECYSEIYFDENN